MKPGPAIAEGERPLRHKIGPSQYERCKHADCQREVRYGWAGGYCLKHHIQHREESEIMDRKYSDEAIKAAVAKHPDNLKAARLELGMSDAGFAYRARKLGLMAPPHSKGKKCRATGASKKTGLGPAAAELLTPEAAAADAQPPPVRATAPARSTSTALAPVPVSGSMGSDGVLDQVEGVISAAQQIVAALRPLGDGARHQVLMLVGGAGVGLPARGEG